MLQNTSAPIVQANTLGKQVKSPEGNLTILEDISFTINAGETVAIVGASGSGKSTLLSLLAGLDTPSAGHVELLGKNLGLLGEDGRAQVRAGQVGFVFQSFQLLDHMTALENVLLPLELGNVKNAKVIARDTLVAVGLEHRQQHYPNQLSGGEQQRVAIARAYAIRPKILFADEPTGNLDQHTGQHIIEILLELNKTYKTTLILVTHNADLAALCTRRIHLSAGRLHA